MIMQALFRVGSDGSHMPLFWLVRNAVTASVLPLLCFVGACQTS